MAFDKFVIERGRIEVKAVAEVVDNTERYERSVMSGYIVSQRRQLNEHIQQIGLCPPVAKLPASLGATADVADKMLVDGMSIAVEDMIFKEGVLGKVLLITFKGFCIPLARIHVFGKF